MQLRRQAAGSGALAWQLALRVGMLVALQEFKAARWHSAANTVCPPSRETMKNQVGGARRTKQGGSAEEPYLRFYHSAFLRTKTLSVLDALEAAEDATSQREALAEIVLELTETGLDYYFVKPVQAAKVGFMAEQSTKLGMAGILRVMGPVTRRVIGGMGTPQLLSISNHIRHLMK